MYDFWRVDLGDLLIALAAALAVIVYQVFSNWRRKRNILFALIRLYVMAVRRIKYILIKDAEKGISFGSIPIKVVEEAYKEFLKTSGLKWKINIKYSCIKLFDWIYQVAFHLNRPVEERFYLPESKESERKEGARGSVEDVSSKENKKPKMKKSYSACLGFARDDVAVISSELFNLTCMASFFWDRARFLSEILEALDPVNIGKPLED